MQNVKIGSNVGGTKRFVAKVLKMFNVDIVEYIVSKETVYLEVLQEIEHLKQQGVSNSVIDGIQSRLDSELKENARLIDVISMMQQDHYDALNKLQEEARKVQKSILNELETVRDENKKLKASLESQQIEHAEIVTSLQKRISTLRSRLGE